MRISQKILITVFSLSSMAFSLGASASDEKFITAAKAIENSIVSLANSKYAIQDCGKGTFAIEMYKIHSHSIDLRKSDSIIYPYTLLVYIDLTTLTNEASPRANGIDLKLVLSPGMHCFRSLREAQSAISAPDFSERNGSGRGFGTLVYQLSASEYKLVNAVPDRFFNLFLSNITKPRNADMWGAVLSGRLPN